MNKIIMFLILTTLAFPAYVTFNVDMSAEDIDEEGVYLWMGFYWPDPGFAMTDADGDGIWTTSLYLSHTFCSPSYWFVKPHLEATFTTTITRSL